jgi:exosome complex component RRP45
MSFPVLAGDVEMLSLRRYVTQKLSRPLPPDGSSAPRRLDGRSLLELRSLDVVRGDVAGRAAASAPWLQLTLGSTLVAAGLSFTLGPTKDDRPTRGRLCVRVSTGVVEDPAPCRVLERFVQDALSTFFDLRQLVVIRGEACWAITVDVRVIAADGGLRAACVYAVALLLDGLELPRTRLPNDQFTQPCVLQLSSRPFCVTYTAHGGAAVIASDASAVEELAADQQASVVVAMPAAVEPPSKKDPAPSPSTTTFGFERSAVQQPSVLLLEVDGGEPSVGTTFVDEVVRRTMALAAGPVAGYSPWK